MILCIIYSQSLCNFTVMLFPDSNGTRLEQVKENRSLLLVLFRIKTQKNVFINYYKITPTYCTIAQDSNNSIFLGGVFDITKMQD